MSLAEISVNARPPHGPLPRGEGEAYHVARLLDRPTCSRRLSVIRLKAREVTKDVQQAKQRRMILPLLGERAGVRAVVPQTS